MMFVAQVQLDLVWPAERDAVGASAGDVVSLLVDRVLHSDWDASVRLVHLAEHGALVAKECVALDADAERALLQLYAALPRSPLLVRPVAGFRSTSGTRVLLFRFVPHSPWPQLTPAMRSGAVMWCIGAQLTHALAELHAVAIVHRNVTLGNVLFNADSGCLRLIDFDDAALLLDDAAELDVIGNGHFMPPEERSDAAMDVFAAGVCLAALYLNVEHLFAFDDRGAAMQSLAERASTDERTLAQFWRREQPNDAPDLAFEAVVWHMLAYDRRQRITAAAAQRQFAAHARAAPT
jgi:serine/threonine protein kinase